MLDGAQQQQLDFMDSKLSKIHAVMRMGAGTTQHMGFQNVFSPETGRKQMATHYRPTPLNKYCKDHKLTYETVKHLKNLTRAGDWIVSFDLAHGYYTLGIRAEDRDFFTVNHGGTLYRLAGNAVVTISTSLPKILSVTYANRCPTLMGTPSEPISTNQQSTRPKRSRRYRRNSRWRGAHLLPYMDDFFFCRQQRGGALQLRDRVASLLDHLGVGRNPKKGHEEPIQVCEHLGLRIVTTTYAFRASPSKLQAIATLSRTILQRSARDVRLLHALQLAMLTGKVQYLCLAIPAARFYLRELHDVLATWLRAQDGEDGFDSLVS
jgi:hypothetical protein